MLTRSGKLQDHFMLRDSFGTSISSMTGLVSNTGRFCRSTERTRAARLNITCIRIAGSGFEPVPDINGRKDTYIAKVNELFGSIRLYLMSAFLSQRPTKEALDLSAATDGDKKKLFGELAGIGYLAGYAEVAKRKSQVSRWRARQRRSPPRHHRRAPGEPPGTRREAFQGPGTDRRNRQ